MQSQLAEADSRRRGLEALRAELAAARDGAAEARVAEAAVRNEAAQHLREQLDSKGLKVFPDQQALQGFQELKVHVGYKGFQA